MMYVLTLTLAGGALAGCSSGPDTPLHRFAKFQAANPSYEADMTVKMNNAPELPFHLKADHNIRLVLRYTGQGVDYLVGVTPKGTVEIDNVQQEYDESPSGPTVRLPSSNLTGVLSTFPPYIYAPSFEAMFPKGTKFDSKGKETVLGLECDVLHALNKGGMGEQDLTVAIDDKGIARRVKMIVTSMQGKNTYEWRTKSVTPVPTWPADAFTVNIPMGYVPYSLPEKDGPVPAGQAFPLTGWSATAGGPLDLLRKLGPQGGLIALLGQDSEPSRRALASLNRLRGGVPLVILTDSARAVPGTDGYDPQGSVLEKVQAPDTPLFLLVDATGKVVHLRMGYDADKAAAFEKDIRDTFAGVPAEKPAPKTRTAGGTAVPVKPPPK